MVRLQHIAFLDVRQFRWIYRLAQAASTCSDAMSWAIAQLPAGGGSCMVRPSFSSNKRDRPQITLFLP